MVDMDWTEVCWHFEEAKWRFGLKSSVKFFSPKTQSKQKMDSTKNSTATNKEEEILPSKDSELTEQFLVTYLMIDKLDVEEVVKIFRDKKIRNVAALLTWERKDVLFHDVFGDLPNSNAFKAITGLLWEFILKYHPERAIQATPPTKRNILLKVDADNTTGLSRFVFSEYTQSEHLQLEAYPQVEELKL